MHTNRTGRKVVADKRTVEKAISIAKSNPGLSHSKIAQRLGVTSRQVQYWLSKDKKREKHGS